MIYLYNKGKRKLCFTQKRLDRGKKKNDFGGNEKSGEYGKGSWDRERGIYRKSRRGLQGGNDMIEATNVSKTFGNIKAVDKVSAVIEEGAVFGLIGTNVLRYEQKTGSLFRYL